MQEEKNNYNQGHYCARETGDCIEKIEKQSESIQSRSVGTNFHQTALTRLWSEWISA